MERTADHNEPIDMGALERKPRAELDRKAIKLGITDAPRLGSKTAVIAAIRERKAADGPEEDPS